MQVSQSAKDWIAQNEGEVLHVYNDGFGYPTAGIGHRVYPKDGLKLGSKITKEQSRKWFDADLGLHAKPVDALVKVPLSQGQYDALVSLVFNIGGPHFASSALLHLLNEGNYAAAATHFIDFIHSAGEVVPGLIRRRNEEKKRFLGK